jgi:hypothetical protein
VVRRELEDACEAFDCRLDEETLDVFAAEIDAGERVEIDAGTIRVPDRWGQLPVPNPGSDHDATATVASRCSLQMSVRSVYLTRTVCARRSVKQLATATGRWADPDVVDVYRVGVSWAGERPDETFNGLCRRVDNIGRGRR